MMTAAVAIILLHTFVPHHHHDVHEGQWADATVMTCRDADCHHEGQEGVPEESCKLQQILAQLTLSSKSERILAIVPQAHLDLAPWMSQESETLVAEAAIRWPEAYTPATAEGVARSHSMRGPPRV